MVGFALTLPITRYAIPYFGAIPIGLGRALAAAVVAAIILLLKKEKLPTKHQLKRLCFVAFGVVAGFPLLSAWAMGRLPASHGAVILALLPLATAGAAAFRAGERPSGKFWIASVIGSIAVLGYAMWEGLGYFDLGDLALLGAVIAAAYGYAEGGVLAEEMKGWRVICWALVLSAPFLIIPVLLVFPWESLQAPALVWASFAYLTLISQLFGFFAWYSGLALGGIAKVGQLQYLQPFVTIFFSVLFLNEQLTFVTVLASVIVVAAVAMGRRAPVKRQIRRNPTQ